MSAIIQYDFFETKEESEIKCLTNHIKELQVKLEKQRRAQFGRIGENTKRINGLEERFEIIERFICKG